MTNFSLVHEYHEAFKLGLYGSLKLDKITCMFFGYDRLTEFVHYWGSIYGEKRLRNFK